MIVSVVIVFSKLLLVLLVFIFFANFCCSFTLSNTKPIKTTGTQGAQRRSHINTGSPTPVVETGAGDIRPTKKRRTVPAAVVEQNTNEGNTMGKRQRTPPAVELKTSRGNTRRMILTRPATADGEPGTDAENAMPTNAKRRPATTDKEPGTDAENTMLIGRRRKQVFERDLTPAERAIPDTTLLSDLGYHLSAYARVGRVRHILICSFLSITLPF